MGELRTDGKRCVKCQEVKPLDQFYASRSTRDGRGSYCRPCQIVQSAANKKRYRAEGRYAEQEKAYKAEYNRIRWGQIRSDPVQREAENAKKRDWYARNREFARAQVTAFRRRRKYGISEEDFAALLTAQQGQCASCGSSFDQTPSGLAHVDHDHYSGAIRGLLCGGCNRAAGMLKDDWRRAKALTRYLKSRPKLLPLNHLPLSDEDMVRAQQ